MAAIDRVVHHSVVLELMGVDGQLSRQRGEMN